MERLQWNGLNNGAITFEARISPANRATLAAALVGGAARMVKLGVMIYEWNTTQNSYLERVNTTKTLNYKFTEITGSLAETVVGPLARTDVPGIPNFAIGMSVKPVLPAFVTFDSIAVMTQPNNRRFLPWNG